MRGAGKVVVGAAAVLGRFASFAQRTLWGDFETLRVLQLTFSSYGLDYLSGNCQQKY